MGKKKKKPQQNQSKISATAYLKSGRARKLPIHECFITANWEESGIGSMVVSRKHVNGNVSFGFFLVDLYCLGVKDAGWLVNEPEFRYREFLSELSESEEIVKTDYAKIHNIIYGALAFAEDCGFFPHADFKLAQMILEEDTDEIPFIEYEFGVAGMPQLVVKYDDPRLSFYLSTLEKYAGEGNYEVVYLDDFMDRDDSELYDPFDEEYEDDSETREKLALKKLEDYDQSDWESFILEVDPDSLVLYRWESFYIFEKAVLEPARAQHTLAASAVTPVEDIKITYDPLENNQTKEEEVVHREIFESLYSPEVSRTELKKLVERIKKSVEKWPQNPSFNKFLVDVYTLLNKGTEKKQASRVLVARFPDYLFGKLEHVQILLEEGKLDQVPSVFNGKLDIASAVPDRELFHISEVISFNTVMCLYYLMKEDFSSAYVHRNIVRNLDIPGSLRGNEELFFKVDIAAIMQVKALVEEAKKDEDKRKALISALTVKPLDLSSVSQSKT